MHRIVAMSFVFATVAHAAPDERHVEAIRGAAAAYRTWKRVDSRPSIAPILCAAPAPGSSAWGAPGRVRMSAAAHGPHGRKLYYLWASDKGVYLDGKTPLPIGFTIVKESFGAVPSQAVHPPRVRVAREPCANVMACEPPPIDWMITADGEQLTIGQRKDLFVMTKVGDVPGSDAGWIYGTVAPDGTVTSAGRVSSCMSCHVEHARRERLFGLPAAPRS